MPDNEVFSPCSIEHQDVFMYEDERATVKCERSDSPTYLDISSNKTTATLSHIKSGTNNKSLFATQRSSFYHLNFSSILFFPCF